MVASHESPLADDAGKLLLAGVRALVPRQLVAAGKATAAILVGTRERPFARVSARMSLQVRRLEVVLAAARVLALVNATARLHRARAHRRGRRGGRSWGRAGDQEKGCSG